MNILVNKLFVMLEKHALVNEEVSGFKFLNSSEFARERQLFFTDLEEQLGQKFDAEEIKYINTLSQLFDYIQKNRPPFHA
ncbi:MAG: hypothetical protein PF489_13410 [Salinivirgaceae bacterium]|jgi:hypothetical protein|nr:hypothetical protein [Salinivirgaceae bacterium]